METIPLPNVQPNAFANSRAVLRIVGAVFAGLIAWIFVATAVNLALRASWPAYHAAELAFNFTLPMKCARLVLGAISSIGAGFVAAWIGKPRMRGATVTGIVLLCLFIPDHYLLWHKFPIWYHLTFLVSLVPLTLLGGLLNRDTCRTV